MKFMDFASVPKTPVLFIQPATPRGMPKQFCTLEVWNTTRAQQPPLPSKGEGSSDSSLESKMGYGEP